MGEIEMASDATWQFVDGDVPGDGAMWLQAPTQLWGFIDFRAGPGAPRQRLMVAARSFVEAEVRRVGAGAKWTAFAAMLVVPDGTPAEMRAAIDDAVCGDLPHFAPAAPLE
jgi:hypothetical protein